MVSNGTASDCTSDNTILFHSNRSGTHELYTVGLDGSGLKILTGPLSSSSFGHFSAGAEKIVFQSDRTGTTGIYIMDSQGGNQTYLADGTLPFFVH